MANQELGAGKKTVMLLSSFIVLAAGFAGCTANSEDSEQSSSSVVQTTTTAPEVVHRPDDLTGAVPSDPFAAFFSRFQSAVADEDRATINELSANTLAVGGERVEATKIGDNTFFISEVKAAFARETAEALVTLPPIDQTNRDRYNLEPGTSGKQLTAIIPTADGTTLSRTFVFGNGGGEFRLVAVILAVESR